MSDVQQPKRAHPVHGRYALLCGACLTVMVQQRPPVKAAQCVNDRCAQRGVEMKT